MPASGISPTSCWRCGAEIPAARAEVESVIETRPQDQGGPFLTLTCARCRTRCGALRNRAGEWLLYPLEGATEPSLLDRIVPRTGREQLHAARAWWLRNAAVVERFRAARAAPAPSEREAPRRRPRAAPRTSVRRPAPRVTPTGPRAVLGVGVDATLADVRRAWRAAVKRWHPDRIPTRDPVVLEESLRRFQEIRSAYEVLVAELGAMNLGA